MSFTVEQRVEQLRKCCETIMDNAEDIIKGYDLPCERTITIHIPAHQHPTITVSQEFLSKKMLDSILKKDH